MCAWGVSAKPDGGFCDRPMTQPAQPGALDHARKLAGLGLQVLPAGHKQKAPTLDWKKYQNQPTAPMLERWFSNKTPSNYWVMTGPMSGIAVLDCDNIDTIRWWNTKLGELLVGVHQVKTRKGRHFYFGLKELAAGFGTWSHHRPVTVADGWAGPGSSGGTIELSFDLRCNGAGVIAAGSVHETGHVYEWVGSAGEPSSLAQLGPVPPELLSAVAAGLAAEGDSRKDSTGQTRSLLTKLLTSVPDEGGRNDWLARVAGHYAKQFRTIPELYDYHVAEAAAKMPTPLDQAEIDKISESIWKKEHEQPPEAPDDGVLDWESKDGTEAAPIRVRAADEDSGYLASGSEIIMCQVKYKVDGEDITAVAPWSDFDIVARGVIDDPDSEGESAYIGTLIRSVQGDRRDILLTTADMSDSRRLNAWLAGHHVTIGAPDSLWPRNLSPGVRLLRYLRAQKPQSYRVAAYLGWDKTEQGFICHEGIIRADGIHPFEQVRPNPAWRSSNVHDWRYGFDGTRAEAMDALRTVATFHDETIAAVHLSWMIAGLLKDQLAAIGASWFPFELVQASSNSAKTTGFFTLTHHLFGAGKLTGGQITPPMLRDHLATHRNGVFWGDDMEELTPKHWEHARNAANGRASSITNMVDRTARDIPLVASLHLSGEGFDFGGQTALYDRSVRIKPPPVDTRRSLIDPTRLQWDDVTAFTDEIGDADGLRGVAGHVVAAALAASEDVLGTLTGGLASLVPAHLSGRFGGTIAQVRAGARVLAAMLGEPIWIERVDAWAATQEDHGALNRVFSIIIPAFLKVSAADNHRPVLKSQPPWYGNPSPAYVEDGAVWINAEILVDWWATWAPKNGHQVLDRTDTTDAVRSQLDRAGVPSIRQGKQGIDHRQPYVAGTGTIDNKRGVRKRYQRLPAEIGQTVIEIAGVDDETSPERGTQGCVPGTTTVPRYLQEVIEALPDIVPGTQ